MAKRFDVDAVVEKKLVVVAFAIVAFVAERVPAVVLVAKVLVEVLFVVVAFVAVKFWRVDDPETNMFPELSIENLVVVANDATDAQQYAGKGEHFNRCKV